MTARRSLTEPNAYEPRDSPARVTSPAPRAIWQALLRADPQALVFQTPAWLDCLCAAGGYADASRLYELPGGRQLVLPLARRVGLPPALTTEASLPLGWGIGGLVGADPLQPADVAAVVADLARRPVARVAVRPNPLAATAWAAATPSPTIALPRLAHVLDLEGGFERVWTQRFTGAARTAVRKAERSGLVVECDIAGKLVPVFYDLLRRSIDRWARQQHEPRWLAHWRGRRRDPCHKFQLIAERLGDACRLWVAWRDGRPAATILVLQGANAAYTWGAMDKELAGPVRANDLLHRLAIEDACRAGCRYYHLGESGESAALAQFKRRFGASAHRYAEYRLERLPLTRVDARLRGWVKHLLGFNDV